MKAKSLLSPLNGKNLKTSGLKARCKRIRIGRNQRVANMKKSHTQTHQAITSHERRSRL
jgi:hypothetical protein